ncbi:TonB-dependent receptor [Roseateles saccharophilus]|uniref:Outer membrane receptor protein involved in Fe transport n=1 Tax=Roseateles saccharophilus TaxID=304 RepID=A0A4R3UF16_ROSSA|nr:TonB-dependent receptor [Roseateles saccharophilus]TCU88307.1 outer membrane receptor protein involved in Fe transport [Roseateles saccharophilus]
MRLKPIARAAALALLPALAAAQTAPEATQQIERVVITAERRVTVLDTTPAAITALSGARLAERGDTGLADLALLSPNTSFTNGQGASQVFIRGIGNVFILAGGDPGVALYNDGAYVSDQTSSNTALFDTQRVEILRGPQGALYGRNATGGAVNIISALPTSSFQARLGLLVGGDNRRESEGFVSGPLSDGLQGRLSYQVRESDGYTRNPLAGQAAGPVLPGGPGSVGPKRLDDLSSRALRGQLQASLGGAGTLRFVAGHYRESDAGMSVPVLADPAAIPVLLYDVTQSSDPRVVKSQGASNRVDVDTALALLELPVGTNTLSASLSWRRSKADRLWDSDGTEALVATSGFSTASTDKGLDIHLASDDAGPWQWMAGVTAIDFDQRQDIAISAQVPLGFIVPGQPLTVPFPGGVGFLLGGTVHTRSMAAYVDLRHALNPQWSLLAGLRVNHDSKRADEYQNIAAFGLAGTGHPSDGWTSMPGSIGVEYKPAAGTLAYARLAHGFKSGAVNLGALQPNLVKPEKVASFELGFKSEFLERRGVLSLAAFSSRYKDMQVSQVGQAMTLLANASAARIDGVEIETALKPLPALTLSAGVGLMDPTYTAFTNVDLRNAPTTPVNVRGRQLAQASRQQLTVGAEWAGSVAELRATLRADYSWRGRFYFTEFNTPDAMQGAYGLLNLSATLRPAAGHWKLWANVRNANDKAAFTSMSIASPVLGAARQVTYTPPRQFAVGLSYDF